MTHNGGRMVLIYIFFYIFLCSIRSNIIRHEILDTIHEMRLKNDFSENISKNVKIKVRNHLFYRMFFKSISTILSLILI